MLTFEQHPAMAALRAERQAHEDRHAAKARALWPTFNARQRAGIRCGLFPLAVMHAAEKGGYDSRLLCCKLMALEAAANQHTNELLV